MLRVVRGAFEALCDALCCGYSGMSHAIPSHVCRGLKWGRWDCNVRGGATESSVIRIACDLWVVRRVDRTPVFGRRPKDAAYHTWGCVRLVLARLAALLRAVLLLAALLDEAVVVFVWVASAGAGLV